MPKIDKNRVQITIYGNTVFYNVKCIECNSVYELELPVDSFCDWYYGNTLIQNAFPFLPKAKRELMISGICPKCWNKMVNDIDEEF